MAKDYYKILGVARDASADDIKKAHRKLARKHHPDLNPGNKSSEEQFKLIQEAYDVLSEPDKRAKYDQFGEQWQNYGFGTAPGSPSGAGSRPPGGGFSGAPFVDVDLGGGANFEDFLENILGGGRRKAKAAGSTANPFRSAPAEDVAYTVDITLEDAYRGASHSISVMVEDVCPDCGGAGQKRNSRGQFDLSGTLCPRCHGTGRVDSARTGTIAIPAGAWEGLKLKLAGQGPANAQGKRGDLFVQLHIKPHAKFERDGQDLYFDVSIPYTVAALGGEATVEMLDGQRRRLGAPPGIQTGQKLRLAGQGMPALQDRKAGDAYARVKISVPRDLSADERKLLEELANLRNDPVRAGTAA